MLSESLEVFRQDNFDHDGQVESFLRHSAAYFGLNDQLALNPIRFRTAWSTSPVIPYQEV